MSSMHGDLAGWRLTLTPTDSAVKLAVSRIVIEGGAGLHCDLSILCKRMAMKAA